MDKLDRKTRTFRFMVILLLVFILLYVAIIDYKLSTMRPASTTSTQVDPQTT